MLCLYVYNVLPPQRLPGSFEDRLCNGQRKIKETRFKKKKKKKKKKKQLRLIEWAFSAHGWMEVHFTRDGRQTHEQPEGKHYRYRILIMTRSYILLIICCMYQIRYELLSCQVI